MCDRVIVVLNGWRKRGKRSFHNRRMQFMGPECLDILPTCRYTMREGREFFFNLKGNKEKKKKILRNTRNLCAIFWPIASTVQRRRMDDRASISIGSALNVD